MEDLLFIYYKHRDLWFSELNRVDRHRLFHLEKALNRVPTDSNGGKAIFQKWSTFFYDCMDRESWITAQEHGTIYANIISGFYRIGFYGPIKMRRNLKDLPPLDWHIGYRERILLSIVELENEYKRFFEKAKYITTCPDCFCPNMESFLSLYGHVKGFHCLVCGNYFEMVV